MRLSRVLTALVIVFSLSACGTLKTPVFANDGEAIRGYDPVAYHTDSTAKKGDLAYAYRYNDAIWLFANEENLQQFQNNPQRYAPQFGGYCAYAMSKGFVVSTDPDAWHIEAGKLYLNYSQGVRQTWLKDVPGNVAKANDHWQQKLSRSDSK